MLSANEILDAVKRGGLDKWRPACEAKYNSKMKEKQKIESKFEHGLKELYNAFGNEQLSTKQLAERLGWDDELVRFRANKLVERKLLKRTTGILPFLFFKA